MSPARLLRCSLLALAAAVSTAQAACLPERVREVLASSPRSSSDASALIASCRDAQGLDFATLAQLGTIAREERDLAAAAGFYDKALALEPANLSAMLDLAVTREWQGDPQAARVLYEKVLERDPDSRAALLGLARVARAQYRFDDARAIYGRLLKANSQDVDARNGMAWIALANQKVSEARAGFDGVLALEPGNVEAKEGLRGVDATWPYELDLAGGYVSTRDGHAWSSGVRFHADLDAIRSIDVGALHYSNELPSANLTQERPLPSYDVRLAYYVRVPDSYNWGVVYDYREHSTLPTEHWLEARGGTWVTDRLQWFASVRAAFGASVWDSQLYQTGVVVPISDGWEIAPTLYYQHTNSQPVPGDFDRSLFAYNVDINRQGPGKAFFNIGAGYSPEISNVDVHARVIWPIGQQGALVAAIQHVSINRQLQATIGWRFYWR